MKNKPLKGVRVGIVREFMVKHVKNDVAISDQVDKEIKTVLRDQLGADLVESVDPMYADDPGVPNMTYTFQDAFAEVLPHAAAGVLLAEDALGRAGVRRARLGCHDRRTMPWRSPCTRRRSRRS